MIELFIIFNVACIIFAIVILAYIILQLAFIGRKARMDKCKKEPDIHSHGIVFDGKKIIQDDKKKVSAIRRI